PWIWSSPVMALRLWRARLVLCAVALIVARFGIWTWPNLPVRSSSIAASVPPQSSSPTLPQTIHELFEKDFPNFLKLAATYNAESGDGKKAQIRFQAHFDYEAKSEFVSVYVGSSDVYEICKSLATTCHR